MNEVTKSMTLPCLFNFVEDGIHKLIEIEAKALGLNEDQTKELKKAF